VSGRLEVIGTVLVSKVGVELIDPFFDFSEQFQFEGWALHPVKVIHAEMRPSEGG
jgi:hypothetical protein